MKIRKTPGRIVFEIINTIILIVIAAICVAPILHVIFASFSDPTLLSQNTGLILWPLSNATHPLTTKGYQIVFANNSLIRGYANTIFYVGVGTSISVLMTCLGAYCVSRKKTMWLKYLMILITATMFFQGGLIPTYLVVKKLGMINTRWCMLIPMAIGVFNLIIVRTSFISLPDFTFAKANWSGVTGSYVLTVFVAYAPVAFVVFAEHLADHKNLSSIVGVNLLEEPGLTRTLLGDGVGSIVGAFFGGCANTTYGESIATVAITRNASTISIWGAAIACIIFSLITPLVAFLETIPSCVMGGVCVALYGFISASGLKMLQPVDLNKNRNLFVASVIFIVGVGGMVVSFGAVEIRTVACALILGILTNVMLSGEKDE